MVMGPLVRVSREFELSEFDSLGSYCSANLNYYNFFTISYTI